VSGKQRTGHFSPAVSIGPIVEKESADDLLRDEFIDRASRLTVRGLELILLAVLGSNVQE
jgi:hypothetical protein